MNYKYVISDSFDPYYNLALENYLYDFVAENQIVLFLWQNENTIVVGRNQVLENECKVHDFLSTGGKIARRMSGGGAVYHDLGNQNFSIISTSANKDNVVFHEIVQNALGLLNIATSYNGRNDILVNDKKFSGNAFHNNGKVFCQHGTILVDCNIHNMTEYLTPDNEKLERNGVKSVASRVVNLSEIQNTVTVELVRKAFIEATSAIHLNLNFSPDELEKRYTLFSDQLWIYEAKNTDSSIK